MRLTFAGAQMEDNKTMAHHGISHESTIHLCLRLLGGMYHATSGRQDNTELQGGVSNATAGSRRQTKTEMVAEPLTHTEVGLSPTRVAIAKRPEAQCRLTHNS